MPQKQWPQISKASAPKPKEDTDSSDLELRSETTPPKSPSPSTEKQGTLSPKVIQVGPAKTIQAKSVTVVPSKPVTVSKPGLSVAKTDPEPQTKPSTRLVKA